jgi:hypothetical protein
MKKAAVIAVAVLLLVASVAFAGTAQNNVGCGIGTAVFKNSADDSTLLQLVQGFLNYFPPLSIVPTIGISAGTAECKQPKKFASNEKVGEFALANMDNLARDIAQGRGETLDAFAELIGVPSADRPEFYSQLQADFARIYSSPDVQMASVVDSIVAVSMQ